MAVRKPKRKEDIGEDFKPVLLALLESIERAKKALRDEAVRAKREREISDLWESQGIAFSYWILIINTINDDRDWEIAETLLKWKHFFVRDLASLLCIQGSDHDLFRFCSDRFGAISWPTLFVSNSPDMLEYIKFEPQLLLSLQAQTGTLHQFVMKLQRLVETKESLPPIERELNNDRFWADLQLKASKVRKYISLQGKQAQTFDVFFSHNSKDKQEVLQLAKILKARGIKVWLDEWALVPGRPWQSVLEQTIETTRAAVILIGKNGLGRWEDPEMRGCLTQFVERGVPVIPVLLPGVNKPPKLPPLLSSFTLVDLRKGFSREGIDRLEWGITGKNSLP